MLLFEKQNTRTRLLSATLNGFRSIRTPQELVLDPDLTVLAGRNNVGKTAFLHALTLPTLNRPGRDDTAFQLIMKWSVAGDELRAALQAPTWQVGAAPQALMDATSLVVELTLEPPRDPLVLPRAQQGVPGDSVLNFGGQTLQISTLRIGDGLLSFARRHRTDQRPPNTATFTWEDGTDARIIALGDSLPGLAFQLCQALVGSIVYVGPRKVATYSVALSQAEAVLDSDGSNLINVLYPEFDS